MIIGVFICSCFLLKILVCKMSTTTLQRSEELMPVEQPASKPYIAARFLPFRLPGQFELGTGNKDQEPFYNRPLDKGVNYKVFFRAYTVKEVGRPFYTVTCSLQAFCHKDLVGHLPLVT